MRWMDFTCWSDKTTEQRLQKGVWLIWHVVVWVICRSRNDRIYNNWVKKVDGMVDEIKVLS